MSPALRMLLVVMLAVAGCSGDKPQATTSPTATISPTSSPSASSRLALGTTYKANLGDGTLTRITVFGYRPAAGNPNNGSSDVIDAVDARVCLDSTATGEPVIVTRLPWRLVYADATQVEADSSGGGSGQPRPEYPLFDRPVSPGSCVRGMVPFVVPRGSRPTVVEYSTEQVGPVRWMLS